MAFFSRPPRLSLVLTIFCISLLFLPTVVAQGPSDVPPASSFLRRATARAVVVGDYLYIDGGEVSQLDSSGTKHVETFRNSSAVNSTLSINLSQSWSSSTVSIRTIPKSAMTMTGQALWNHDGVLYIWGGHVPNFQGEVLGPPASWKFTTDGRGGGSWSEDTPNNPTEFNELLRSEDGSFVTTPSAAFWIGGVTGPTIHDTDVALTRHLVPGMVSFNFTTKSWKNETTTGIFSANRTLQRGSVQYVPSFGPNGLVMLLGGTPGPEDVRSGYLTFQNLTFFDPVTRAWYWQTTTGDAPTPRTFLCTAGVAGKNGTYEIFVFGGLSEQDKPYDDVFILSLPAFTWTTVPYAPKNRRYLHSCVVGGKRQMLVVGGLGDEHWDTLTPDPWPQGLGIFDMTDLEWKTEYNANAEDYETPSTVKTWYDQNTLESVEWSSPQVKELFLSEKPKDDPNDDPKDEKTTPVGAIVGGVVGGVAAIALAGAVFWFMRRRKRRAIPSTGYPPDQSDSKATPFHVSTHQPEHHYQSVELASPVEVQADVPGGRGHRAELSG
ncbi:kelch repeat protein [Colletotrichum musicola]|uniref:Kelch repeat protein n=1 Tax=Colletotrichum musicola TaxID=2175873 RepID=A0A8H6KK85_9PEZI|nr:kelch repeat protein [Colletotrichum musicola]